MKNKEYISPEVIIVEIDPEGVICLSGHSSNSNNSNLLL